jgi:hypothetical protein
LSHFSSRSSTSTVPRQAASCTAQFSPLRWPSTGPPRALLLKERRQHVPRVSDHRRDERFRIICLTVVPRYALQDGRVAVASCQSRFDILQYLHQIHTDCYQDVDRNVDEYPNEHHHGDAIGTRRTRHGHDGGDFLWRNCLVGLQHRHSTVTSSRAGFPTVVAYYTRPSQAGGNNNRRSTPPTTTSTPPTITPVPPTGTASIPRSLATHCGTGKALTSKISSACSFYSSTTEKVVKTVSTTVSSTSLTTVTVTGSAKVSRCTASMRCSMLTSRSRLSLSRCLRLNTRPQTVCQTSTVSVGGAGFDQCGTAVSTYTTGGRITYANTASGAQQTNARFRIEGGASDGTIFEGCIASGPRSITTPSGGTHLCDGTNNNAKPSPGATLTTQIDAAGDLNGFDFDGTYSSSSRELLLRLRRAACSGASYAIWYLHPQAAARKTLTMGTKVHGRTTLSLRTKNLWRYLSTLQLSDLGTPSVSRSFRLIRIAENEAQQIMLRLRSRLRTRMVTFNSLHRRQRVAISTGLCAATTWCLLRSTSLLCNVRTSAGVLRH